MLVETAQVIGTSRRRECIWLRVFRLSAFRLIPDVWDRRSRILTLATFDLVLADRET